MNVLSIILWISSLINGYLAVVCFKNRKAPGATTFGFILTGIVFYSLGYAFEMHSRTIPQMLFWLKIEYLGISFFPALLIIFLLQFLGNERWLKPWLLTILFSISGLTLIIHYTTTVTHWFYSGISTITRDNLTLIQTTKGFWYWIHQGYTMIAIGLFTSWFLSRFLQDDNIKRRQSLLMVLSSLAPWICYLIYITGKGPEGIDLVPFSFSVMGFIIVFGMIRYKLFDLTPLALTKIFQHLTDGVIIIDRESRILNFNNSAREIFGDLNEKHLGKSILSLGENCPILADLIKEEDFLDRDVEVSSEGSVKHFEVKISIIYNKNINPIGKSLIFREITERKNTEQKLILNQDRLKRLNQTKDKLFSIIGHDLRGSISNIQTIASLLNNQENQLTEADKSSLHKTILTSSQQSLKFLENMLMWAKSQIDGIKSFPGEFNLKDLVNDSIGILKPIADEKDISIEIVIPDTIKVFADTQMISLVIRNLVSNAIKFSHRNGRIRIMAASEGQETIVRVQDHGIGIPENLQVNLFKVDSNVRRSGTEKEPGTGLGLLLCKEFIDHHHGRIGIENTSDKGTTFFFAIPEKEIPVVHP